MNAERLNATIAETRLRAAIKDALEAERLVRRAQEAQGSDKGRGDTAEGSARRAGGRGTRDLETTRQVGAERK